MSYPVSNSQPLLFNSFCHLLSLVELRAFLRDALGAAPYVAGPKIYEMCTGPQGKTSGGIHQETNKSEYGWKTYHSHNIDQYSTIDTIVHTIHNDNHGNTSNCHNNASNHNYHSKHHNVLVTDNASGHQDILFKNVLQALGWPGPVLSIIYVFLYMKAMGFVPKMTNRRQGRILHGSHLRKEPQAIHFSQLCWTGRRLSAVHLLQPTVLGRP